jgi:DNA-binding response OmpR family regulator
MTKIRALVIEDEPQIVEELHTALKNMGHAVCATAATERAAIAAARAHKPDLLIVGAQLRIGDSMAAIKRICDERPVPHILLAQNRTLLLSRMPGATIVQKPFKPSDLQEAVQRACPSAA